MKYKPLDMSNDCTLGALDDALFAAERALLPLLLKHKASEVFDAFAAHAAVHAFPELSCVQSGKDSDGCSKDSLGVIRLRNAFLSLKRQARLTRRNTSPRRRLKRS